MKRAFHFILAVAAALLAAPTAHAKPPYTLVIVAEKATSGRAVELRRQLLEFDPFNRMGKQFDVKVVTADREEMGCPKKSTPNDTIDCDEAGVWKKAAEVGGHAVIALPNIEFRSSADQKKRIVKVDPSMPVEVAVHEFMHLHEFDDEYDYQANTPQFGACDTLRDQKLNTTLFSPLPSYESGAAALKLHGKQIPWSGLTVPQLIVDDRKLGTRDPLGTELKAEDPVPVSFMNTPGLYAGAACKGKTVWRPFKNTIMRMTSSRIQQAVSGAMPALYKVWLTQAMSKVAGGAIQLHPPVDPVCYRHFDTDFMKRDPALAAFEERLKQRLDAVYPQSRGQVSKILIEAVPRLKQELRRMQGSKGCLASLKIEELPNGDFTFLPGKTDQESVYKLRSRMRSVRLDPLMTLLSKMQKAQNTTTCGGYVAESAVMFATRTKELIRRTNLSAILSGAELRAIGEGEPDFDRFASELRGNKVSDSYENRLVRTLLTPELYDAYRAALKKHHPASGDFDCAARLQERKAAAAQSPRSPAPAKPDEKWDFKAPFGASLAE